MLLNLLCDNNALYFYPLKNGPTLDIPLKVNSFPPPNCLLNSPLKICNPCLKVRRKHIHVDCTFLYYLFMPLIFISINCTLFDKPTIMFRHNAVE